MGLSASAMPRTRPWRKPAGERPRPLASCS